MHPSSAARDLLLTVFPELLDHLPCGVVVIDPDAYVRYVNPKAVEQLADTGAANPVGARLHQEPVLQALTRELDLGAVCREGIPVACHASPRTGYHGRMTYSATLIPFATPAGDAGGLVLFITGERAGMEPARDFVQAEKYSALNTVIAGVAHEINNPLTSILGTAQYLLSKATDLQQAHRLRRICEESERCGKIVSNLVSYSRRFRLIKEPVDLNHLVDETVALCRYQMEIDGIEVLTRLDPVLPPVPLQTVEMQRVFVAILNNAHQALREVTERPRTLTVSTQCHGDVVRILFADNGPGVSADARDRVFDPFFSTRGLGSGTGLGLSVAYGLAQDHGGRLWLENMTGQGAKFIMELPLDRKQHADCG